MRLARALMIAAGLAAMTLVAGCGRPGVPTLENGAKPAMARPPNAVATPKVVRPYGKNWPYPRREGIFPIDPPDPEPVKPKGSFFLDPLL